MRATGCRVGYYDDDGPAAGPGLMAVVESLRLAGHSPSWCADRHHMARCHEWKSSGSGSSVLKPSWGQPEAFPSTVPRIRLGWSGDDQGSVPIEFPVPTSAGRPPAGRLPWDATVSALPVRRGRADTPVAEQLPEDVERDGAEPASDHARGPARRPEAGDRHPEADSRLLAAGSTPGMALPIVAAASRRASTGKRQVTARRTPALG